MTKIEWAEETINPFPGCTKVSEGCDNCYAARQANRFKGGMKYGGLVENGEWTGRTRFWPGDIDQITKWRKPKFVFVNSMGDLFHPGNTFEQLDYLLCRMLLAPQHTFLLLTKRPARMAEYFNGLRNNVIGHYDRLFFQSIYPRIHGKMIEYRKGTPFKNIYLGVTAENQQRANERIPILLQITAAVRFVSVEPMLEFVQIRDWLYQDLIQWVICGGESGPGARPVHPRWARSLRNQCADISFFFKQWGSWIPGDQCGQSVDPYAEGMPEWSVKKGNFHRWDSWLGSFKVGKKKAGRVLDGRTWDQYPKP
ncbi:MAG: phage Gp37/Gp68 family protein [Desulfosarcina sp.]|nr:phage Gp37/Gp68 family protein [Desulfosarcina sp.]